MAVGYLKQGLTLAERDGDRHSEALCCVSLGIAYNVQADYTQAIAFFEQGLKAIDAVGDLALRGRTYRQLSEAHYGMKQVEQATFYGVLGMYLLHQIESPQWRQAAGLMTVIQGQHPEDFSTALEKYQSQLKAVIGVDGYDAISELLELYRHA